MAATDFALSRIFAEGWRKAQELSAEEVEAMDQKHAAAMNPYPSEPERARWGEGFARGVWGDKAVSLSQRE